MGRKGIYCGLIISIIIEIKQYYTRRGLVEIDDIIYNTFCTLIGEMLIKLIMKCIKSGEK